MSSLLSSARGECSWTFRQVPLGLRDALEQCVHSACVGLHLVRGDPHFLAQDYSGAQVFLLGIRKALAGRSQVVAYNLDF